MAIVVGDSDREGTSKMIKKIKISNMKSIVDMNATCSNMNLLVGTNSSGKSTIIQALSIVAQNSLEIKGINGVLTNIGDFEDLKTRLNATGTVGVLLSDENGEEISCEVARGLDASMDLRIKTTDSSIAKRMNYSNKTYQYLSCDRIGPRNTYEKNNDVDEVIGVKGEYAIAYLNRHKVDIIDQEMCKNRLDFTLGGQVNWWLEYIVGADISTEDIAGTEFVKASYTVGSLNGVRPVNIGAGTSYLISVLIMCLASVPGAKLAIENPEIHLHPSAQSRLAEFLYFISCHNRQLFIETHSDHLFNAVRVGMANGTMNSSTVKILFIYQNDKSATEVLDVVVGKYGKIKNQQKDLFDQFDMDLNRMLGM